MIVNRDILKVIETQTTLEALVLWGPRQVGKTTLLDLLPLQSRIMMDDLALREQARKDPSFLLDAHPPPVLIDEVQYAPEIVPEIKLRIDKSRREALKEGTRKLSGQYYLTGSNKQLVDDRIKESLAGRCHVLTLHGLSVHEIKPLPQFNLRQIVARGGFPELYTREGLPVRQYLNDYILSFIEKDIAQGAGIQKLGEFQTVLRLLAARTGQFLNVSEISQSSGVDSKTVDSWIHTLQRNLILDLVPPFFTNLSKRVTKMKKLYFYDTGLCARLQGHIDEEAMFHSPQMGGLFETLVFSEIVKTRDHFVQDWQLYTWRTKEKNEIDFILEKPGKEFLFLEAKLGSHGAFGFELDAEAKKVFPAGNPKRIVVTAAGELKALPKGAFQVPIAELAGYLMG